MATRPAAVQIDALARLRLALAEGAGHDVEAALLPLWSLEPDSELMPEFRAVLVHLLEAPWHQRHEDVAREIQTLRIAEAVPALERMASTVFEYLRYYDDGHAFSRKCIWALADIGTPQAFQALQRISKSADTEVAGYALKRLARWQDERGRKLYKDGAV
jgi:hypothetical protein